MILAFAITSTDAVIESVRNDLQRMLRELDISFDVHGDLPDCVEPEALGQAALTKLTVGVSPISDPQAVVRYLALIFLTVKELAIADEWDWWYDQEGKYQREEEKY